MQLFQLDAHLDAQFGVEVRQWLVEQEHLRVPHDRPPEGDALALTARQLPGLALQEFLNAEDLGRVLHALGDVGAVEFPHFQAKGHIVVDAHMRVERVVLKHHRDVAIHRRQIVDDLVVDQDAARGDRLEPGDHPQCRRLAAARRTDKDHEFLVVDTEVDVLDGVDLVELLVQALDDGPLPSLSPC